MFCKKCGAQLPDNTVICPSCGTAAEMPTAYPYAQPQNPYDTGHFGWAVLGFFIPLVGLILFLVWRNDKPRCAKRAGIGALVGVIAEVVFSTIFSALFAALFMELFGEILVEVTGDPNIYYDFPMMIARLFP